MKKWKLKALTAVVSLAFVGSASATIVGAGSENGGELFFSAWDSGSQTSYTRDLGVTLGQFLTNTGTHTNTPGGSLGVTSAGFMLSFAADSVLTGWFSGLSAAALAGLQWNIGAMDNQGSERYLTTVNGAPVAPTNATLKQWDAADLYVSNVNSGPWVSGSHAAANGSSVIASTSNANGYSGAAAWGTNWGGRAGFSNAGGLGQSLDFYAFDQNGTGNLTPADFMQYGNENGKSTWTFASDGTLTFASPAAVIPIPGAVWLLGSGLLGLAAVARRRKQPVQARSNLAAFA